VLIGQLCAFADVLIKERNSIFFDMNIADYIQAVPADDFDAAIGQKKMCNQRMVHGAPS
jgi:hypothetical protein